MNSESAGDRDLTPFGIAELELDRVIHERARLKVLTYLSTVEKTEVGFTELRDRLGFTGGNLSVQLRTLEEAGYVKIGKRFIDDKPFTGVELTVAGHRALASYVTDLEFIVASLKETSKAEKKNSKHKGAVHDDLASR
jgi:DNA-binding MarR family transcriptional regulator